MPKLTIDNLEIEVPEGTKVIAAAEELGIIIPRFCYHPALGSLGACRMCAVKFLEGPVKGVEMSCMEEARDGMVVSTTDDEAVDFRRHNIEWLMKNHPHDCPVCDEGGHCLLQDLTVAGGHGSRRFSGKKRTYQDQDLGPFVQHEMNRCIHCYRCRRFYREKAGYRDFGAMQIGSRMYFGRAGNGPLESPFSGNIIDLCPTGVLTDKPSRYKGRRWDYERSSSLCLHCSLGCRVVASARYREVVRMEAGFSEAVNGYFICDRGRYGFDYANHPRRPRRARIGEEEVPFDHALQVAAERLSDISLSRGPGAVACQGSGRSSLETMGWLKWLSRRQGWPDPGYLIDPFKEAKTKKAVSRLEARLAVSLRQIEQADFILMVGTDPVNEAPMAALAVRQAFLKGAPVMVIDPRPVSLPLAFEHLSPAPDDLDRCLIRLIKGAGSFPEAKESGAEALPWEPAIEGRLKEWSRKMKASRRPVIISGTDVVREHTPALAADLVLGLQALGQQAGLFYVLPEANSFGAALLSSAENSFLKILEAIEKGSLAGLVIIESDPFRLFPDRYRLERALRKLDFLLVLDFLPTQAGRQADIFLPTRTLFEAGGSFINQEGRVQRVHPVHHGGVPLEQVGNGGHPPRIFRKDIPGGEPRPAGQILTELDRLLSPGPGLSLETLWDFLAREHPSWTGLKNLDDHPDGIRILPDQGKEKPFSPESLKDPEKNEGAGDSLELLLVDWTFGTEELSTYSDPLRKQGKGPCLTLPVEAGTRRGLQKGERVVLSLDSGLLEVTVELAEKMAAGVMVLPRHEQLDWQQTAAFPIRVPLERIRKAQ